MNLYLRLKYAGTGIQAEDHKVIGSFQQRIGPSIRAKVGAGKALINYFNRPRALRYFQNPVSTEPETTTP